MPGHAPIHLLIFDSDGVLVDSERISHAVLQTLLAEHGAALSFDETVERFIGASLATGMQRVSELFGGAVPEGFHAELARRTRQAFARDLAAVPGVGPLLARLAVPFCVASNGQRAKVDFTLGHTGLAPRFDGRIFTADDVMRPKPAPDLFLHAAAMLGADAARTLVVEDTPTGILAAKAAGMTAIGFAAMTPAERLRAAGADALVASMHELAALLAGRGACRR